MSGGLLFNNILGAEGLLPLSGVRAHPDWNESFINQPKNLRGIGKKLT